MLALHVDCVEQPRLLCEPVHGCRAAGWFWSVNGLASWADAGDIDGVSDLVNRGKKTVAIGDANGFAERKAIYERALEVIP